MNKSRHIGFEGGMKVLTTKKEMRKDLPQTKKWVKNMKAISIDKKSFDKSAVEHYYACSFAVPNNQEELAEYIADAEYALGLMYEERLNFELSRLNICAYVRHKSTIVGDKVPNNKIPKKVIDVLSEIVKVKMLVEYEIYGQDEIKMSIPELDKTKVNPSIIQKEIDALKQQLEEEPTMELDSILDKINKYGINAISKEEMEFLNDQSRRI